MNDFLETFDIDLWDFIKNGYNTPSSIVDSITILKPKRSWK